MKILKKLFGWAQADKNKLPDGWTETKISKNAYKLHIPQEQKDKWVADRHKHDKVDELIKQDGFYDRPYGRAGTIYHVNNGRLCEFDYEISGVKRFDILIFSEELKEWLLPEKKLLTLEEKLQIIEKLKLWLEQEKIKAEL